MPISLLLQEVTAAFRYAGKNLAPWSELVDIEERLIERAQSLFLVRWFGRDLPLHGYHLRIAFANLGALQQRYTEMDSKFLPRAQGPNLLEPLAGMAGALAGMALSPGVAIGLVIAIWRKINWSFGSLLEVLASIGKAALLIASPFLATAAVAASPALALGGAAFVTAAAAEGSPGLRSVFDILGALARLMREAAKFIALLLGPVEDIKNPLVRAAVSVVGVFAKLMPFVYALVAETVARFAPALAPLKEWLGAFVDFAKPLVDTMVAAATDIKVAFMNLFGDEKGNLVAPLKHIFAGLQAVFGRIGKVYKDTFAAGATTLIAWREAARSKLKTWLDAIWPAIKAAILSTPTVVNTLALKNAMSAAAKVFKDAAAAKPPEPAKPPVTALDFWLEKAGPFGAYAGAAADSFPTAPKLETPSQRIERLKLRDKYQLPPDLPVSSPFDFDVRAREASDALPPVDKAVSDYVERVRKPRGFFVGEQAALAKELGAKTPVEALQKARGEEQQLRELALSLIDRILPKDLKSHLSFLPDLYAKLDETLKLKAETTSAAPPVKLVREETPALAPRVERMIVRASGGDPDAVADFVERLRAALRQPIASAPA